MSNGNRGQEHWAVVNTHPSRERLVLEHLDRQDFRAYCPFVNKPLRRGSRTIDTTRPLFPGYIFVQASRDSAVWRPILSTFGVRSVIRFGDQLGLVDAAFIRSLQDREEAGIVVPPQSPYEPGQSVRVSGGPFDGVIATILALDEKRRLVLLMQLMQREVVVKVEAAGVEPIGRQ